MSASLCPQCGRSLRPEQDWCARCLLEGALHEPDGADLLVPPDPAVPFGNYTLLARLGRGGMGVVWRARHRSATREVALKTVSLHSTDPAADRRFRAEAEAAAGLEHPHIVPVYDVGEVDGQLFFTMRLLGGGTLAAPVPARGPRAFADAAAVVEKVARAVHHAHQRGVLHRDLKPANILLDEAGTPFVADFGLARRMDAAEHVTVTGAVLGTPHAMAPEQAAGRGESVTVATDVYGLGVILYELLAGTPPFAGGSMVEVLRAVVHDEPPRPSQRRPGLPRDLETICLKCLEKDPARRYASAEALADDLAAWQRGEPVKARPATRLERTRRWARRHRVTAALAVVVPLGIAAVLVQGWRHQRDLQKETAEARASRDEADRQRAEAVRRGEEAARQTAAAERARAGAAHDRDRLALTLYATDMQHAWQAWHTGFLSTARELLDGTDAAARGLEWQLLAAQVASRQPPPAPGPGPAVLQDFPASPSLLAWAQQPGLLYIAGDGFLDTRRLADGAREALLPGRWTATAALDAAACRALTEKWMPPPWGPAFAPVPENDAAWLAAARPGQPGNFNRLAVSSDGALLLAGCPGGWTQCYDTATGTLRALLPCAGGGVACAAAGTVAAAGSTSAKGRAAVRLDFAAGPPAQPWPGAGGLVALSGDGTLGLQGNGDGAHLLLHRFPAPVAGGPVSVPADDSWAGDVALSPDGRYGLASINATHALRLIDTATGRVLTDAAGNHDLASSIAISSDSAWIASAGADRTLRVWATASGPGESLREAWPGHGGADVFSVAFLDPPSRLASAGADGTVRLWDTASDHQAARILAAPSLAENRQALLPSPDGQWLAGTQWLGAVNVVSLRTGHAVRVPCASGGALGWTPEGALLVAVPDAPGAEGAGPFTVETWPFTAAGPAAAASRRLPLVESSGRWIFRRLSPDATHLAGSVETPAVAVWDLRTGACPGHDPMEDKVQNLAWSPDGKFIAGSIYGSALIVAQSSDGGRRFTKRESCRVHWLEFSPDGQLLAAANYRDRRIVLLDPATGEERGELSGHDGAVTQVAFSPDGRTLLSIGQDQTVRLWHLPTRREIAILSRSAGYERLAIGPGGSWIAWLDADKTCRLWRAGK